ncbi:MAG: AAA family ATPase [Actinomycetota bacterium]|nr:AAA family ATPase [Actinomycetota bacterium]
MTEAPPEAPAPAAPEPPAALPPELSILLLVAESEAKARGNPVVLPAHLVLAMRSEQPEIAAGMFDGTVDPAVTAFLDAQSRTFDTPTTDPSTLALLARCAADPEPVRALARALQELSATLVPTTPEFALPDSLADLAEIIPRLPPIAARADAVRRVITLLSARVPQAPLLVAPSGHGRTLMARCLAAQLFAAGYAGPMAGWPVVRVKPEKVIAGRRTEAVMEVFATCRGRAVVYLDDIEVLCGLGMMSGDFGMLTAFRSALHDRDQRVVLAVASEFVDRFQAADRELYDELERIDLPPLPEEDVLAIAQAAATELGEFHGVEVSADVVTSATAPPRQIDSKGHPFLAVSRIDRAAAAAAFDGTAAASAADLGPAVAGQQYVAFDAEAASARLKEVVLGQDESIDKVTQRLSITRAALDTRPERPDGVFLFAGPTGTGKTELALRLAAEVYGTDEALIRLDMSEYATEYTQSKLVGSPPGYIGSNEPESWLTTKIRRRPQCVLLLDEIEKAHPRIWDAFLQVFDAGRLTDTQGRVADFRDVIVVMTTNLGSGAFADRRPTGFIAPTDESVADEREVREEIKHWMRPELLNRLDAILVFRPLSPDTVRRIVTAQVEAAVARLALRGWVVTYAPDVIDELCTEGYSKEYGARPLLRALEEHFLGRIQRLPRGPVVVSVVEGSLMATAG